MARKKYRRGGTSISFKSIGQGLRASEERLKEKAQTEIDSIKLAKLQHKEASDLQIGGLSDAGRFEEGVLGEKQKLENAVRNRQYDALSVKAERTVERIKGEAKEYEKQAQHWKELTPKMGKALWSLSQAGIKYAEHLETQHLNEQNVKNGLYNPIDKEQSKARLALYKAWLADSDNPKLDTPENYHAYLQSFAGRDNQNFANQENLRIKNNSSASIQAIRYHATKNDTEGNSSWTKGTVEDVFLNAGYEHLAHIGIDPSSKGGRDILQTYRTWGALEKNKLVLKDDAQLTRTGMIGLVEKLRAEPGEEMEKLLFGQLVRATSKGTFIDEDGNAIIGMTNKADAWQQAAEFYVQINFEDFGNETELRNWLEKFTIVGDEAKAKGKKMSDAHPLRMDEIVGEWSKLHKDKKTRQGTKLIAENTTLKKAFTQRLAEHNKNKNENPEYKISDKEFYVKEVKSAINESKGDTDYKNHVYTAAGLARGQYTSAGKWANVESLIQEGRTEEAIIVFSGFSTEVKDQLRPQFELFQSIRDSKFKSGKHVGTVAAVHHAAKRIILGSQRHSDTLSDSGDQKAYYMVDKILEGYNLRINGGIDPVTAMEDAVKAEEIKYKDGSVSDTKWNETAGNPYDRILAPFENQFGKKKKHYVFRDQVDENEVELRWQGNNLGAYLDAQKELQNTDLDEVSTETVIAFTKDGGKDLDWWLKNMRFVSPKKIKELADLARTLSDSKYKSFVTGMEVPKNISTLAELTGHSDIYIINKIFDKYYNSGELKGTPVRFAAGGQDGVIWKSDTKKWVSERNILPISGYQAAKKQGIIPKRQSVATWENMLKLNINPNSTGLSTDYDLGTRSVNPADASVWQLSGTQDDKKWVKTDLSAKNEDTSNWPAWKDPQPYMHTPSFIGKNEAFLKTIDVVKEAGIYSDPKKFLENNGALYIISWEEMDSMFGLKKLQNIHRLREGKVTPTYSQKIKAIEDKYYKPGVNPFKEDK